MCGMFMTFNKDNIDLLSEYNSKRGGIRTIEVLNINGNDLYVVHYQAPTSELSGKQPHVIEEDRSTTKLWHNGILKESAISELYEVYSGKANVTKWDTSLLHYAISKEYELSDIDGSFAVFYHVSTKSFGIEIGGVYFARNAIAPLFMNDETKEVSSVKIPELGITKLVPDGVWHLLIHKDEDFINLYNDNEMKRFKTKNNPYDL